MALARRAPTDVLSCAELTDAGVRTPVPLLGVLAPEVRPEGLPSGASMRFTLPTSFSRDSLRSSEIAD